MSSEENPPRRQALQKLILVSIGAIAVLLGVGGYEYSTRPSYISIQVQYAGMSTYIPITAETLKVKSPAKLSNLEAIAWRLHPALQTMPAMQVLLNGTAADGNPELKEGDLVVFLSLMAGG